MAVVDAASKDIDLKSGREFSVWIEYRSSEKLIQVWVGHNSRVKPVSPFLEEQIDVLAKFEEFMYVGFTASNGNGSAIHSVNQWRFRTFDASLCDATPMELNAGDDCLICKPGEMNEVKHSSFSNHVSNSF